MLRKTRPPSTEEWTGQPPDQIAEQRTICDFVHNTQQLIVSLQTSALTTKVFAIITSGMTWRGMVNVEKGYSIVIIIVVFHPSLDAWIDTERFRFSSLVLGCFHMGATDMAALGYVLH